MLELRQRLQGMLRSLRRRRGEPPPVEAEYLRLIFRNLAVSTPISLALVIYLAYQVDAAAAPLVISWSWLCGSYLALRWVISLFYPHNREPDARELRRWSVLSVLLQGSSGLLLGALALFVLPSMELYAQLGVTMVVMILASAMAFSLSGRWIDSLVFAPPVYLSFAWAVHLQEHPYAQGASLLALGLLFLHLFYANNHRNSISQGFEVARRSAELARELQTKNIEFQEVAGARSRLLATVSHDLRQPAHAIGLLSERAMADTSFESVKSTLRDLNELSQSLSASLITLMDLTRLDAGLVQPRVGPVCLALVLARLEGEFGSSARAKGITLVVERSNCWVHSDAVLLYGVLTNLVSNAIKYTRRGRVEIRLVEHEATVQVQVSDTGVGIHADKLDLIFKEFVRLDASDAGTEGLGLGLSIVRRYASLLFHQLSVRSEPGQGSTFSIAMKRVDAPQQALEQASLVSGAQDERLCGVRVMVIDNVELLLVSMSKTLAAWDCEVDSAHNLNEALHCASLRWPDLLVTDYHLGDRESSGLELIKALSQQAQLTGQPQVRALLMTGDVSAQLEAQASEVGVQILHKPVRPKVLRASLIDLLSQPSSAPLDR